MISSSKTISAVFLVFLFFQIHTTVNGLISRQHFLKRSSRVMMSTITPTPGPPPSTNPNGGPTNGGFVIIAPDKGEQEVKILQNFNQIQLGGSAKIGQKEKAFLKIRVQFRHVR